MWAASQHGSPVKRRTWPPSTLVSPWLHAQCCSGHLQDLSKQTEQAIPFPEASVATAAIRSNHSPCFGYNKGYEMHLEGFGALSAFSSEGCGCLTATVSLILAAHGWELGDRSWVQPGPALASLLPPFR